MTLPTGTGSVCKKVLFNKSPKALKILSKAIPLQLIHREISIHRSLCHNFVIQYVAHYEEPANFCLVMDYAEHNLRSLVVPGIGIAHPVAHMLFVQLSGAVAYLHSKGICHRDIKPDNLLLTRQGNLKLADFGHSTLFRHRDYRRLKSIAGTHCFMAPEVLAGDYDGPAADLFSMGISLLNLLTGKLPWDSPSRKDERFRNYRSMRYHFYEPFNELRQSVLGLVEGLLADECDRMTLPQVQGHKWVTQASELLDDQLSCTNPGFLSDATEAEVDLHYTQPEAFKAKGGFLNISQPVQLPNLPSVKRFYVDGDRLAALAMIEQVLGQMAVLFEAKGDFVSFSTTDTKRNTLVGEVGLQEMGASTGVTIKRTRGDVFEFKKFLDAFGGYFSTV